MTLDERIRTDIEERLNGKEISAAKALAKFGFSTKGLPGYFGGDRNAKTVFIHLNPGRRASEADNMWSEDVKNFNQTSVDAFLKDLTYRCVNYGELDAARFDEFDVKQAAFLTPWKDCGIDLPQEPNWHDKNTRLEAKKNVLCQKLQLELIPYASSTFDSIRGDEEKRLFLPFIDTLLDEIFAKPRLYVIFASAKFEELFKFYNTSKNSQTFVIPRETKKVLLKSTYASFKVIEIHYNGKTQKALIARTFPSQGLGRAFDLMQKYGKSCYEEFIKS
ncbi:MAG: hypothetical protein K6G73_01515 [Marinilabiliaceae bacterium]|nr:hypothetical protein [Marinilabiliaceae bacterium]